VEHQIFVLLVKAVQHEGPEEVVVETQNLTIRLDQATVRKAKVLAARRGTSVSKLVAQTIEQLVDGDEAYEAARRKALDFLRQGFHLGGTIRVSRDELHER